jgi:ubiquinone/menaquinone biosynthesis C-methylase UbiE
MKPFKLFAIATAVLAGLAAIYVAYSAIGTLGQLDAIERDRDRWQHPQEILAALNLRDGATAIDFGSGAGYFALKLAPLVGRNGRVVAIDLRRLSLFFLRTRAVLKGFHQIETVRSRRDIPDLSPASADAILVSNTYHELGDPAGVMKQFFRSLRPNGRLVIVDRRESTDSSHGKLTPEDVGAQLRQNGFQIVEFRDALLIDPGGDKWWMITAQRPA